MEKIYTPQEVADLLKVSRDTVMGLIHSGKLKATEVGNGTKRRRFRVSQSQIVFFLAITYNTVGDGPKAPKIDWPELKISRHMKRLEKARA